MDYLTVEEYARMKGIDLDKMAAERCMTRAELVKDLETRAKKVSVTLGRRWFSDEMN